MNNNIHQHFKKAFTLIEMSIVVAIIGILYFTVAPMYGTTILRARETALKDDLQTLRKVLDQYYKDRQIWPESLEALVREGYLRAIPTDPITNRNDTWQTIPSDTGKEDIFDVRSGSNEISTEGSPYASW